MTSLGTIAYILAALLFIMALAGLSKQETAKYGCLSGMVGMALALFTTFFSVNSAVGIVLIILAMVIGACIGIFVAMRVQMTQMPELIACLHSFVGLAAVLVGYNSFIETPNADNTHLAEVFLGVFIGAVTFTGSIVAYGKLNGTYKLRIFKSAPLQLPGGHFLNLVAIVISMLNSYSGWAAAASGFMLSNDLLIVTGALVGSSGAILSYIMCKAMNRSFISVIAGGFGNAPVAKKDEEVGEYHEMKANEVAELLKNSSSVIITPGYGMAVAQAQNAVATMTEKLKARGINVRFAIHPVAGRLPGHMNVLLAEAKVPYDIVFEMDEINDEFEDTDTVLVIGANDTVNPAAAEDPSSPIAGMPVLEVWKARNVVIFKRSMNTGYAGVQNPLFFKDNSYMCFGDAKKTVEEIVSNLD